MLLLAAVSRGVSLDERFPYLFFKYLAHELSASLSPSEPPPRSGETSRDFNACVDRLRDNSEPDDNDDVPYLCAKRKNYFRVKIDRRSPLTMLCVKRKLKNLANGDRKISKELSKLEMMRSLRLFE